MCGTILWSASKLTGAGRLRYYVLEQDGTAGFGIGICSAKEAAFVPGVTGSRSRAQAWAGLLLESGVRPCHLNDVLENLICCQE